MRIVSVFFTGLMVLSMNQIIAQTSINSGRDLTAVPQSLNEIAEPALQPAKNGISTEESDFNKQLIAENLTVDGSLAVGTSSVEYPDYGLNTILLTESNLRIHFDDNSTSSGFAANDWTLVANDDFLDGEDYFAIKDATADRVPFKVMAGAPNNSLFCDDNGYLGLGSANPGMAVHAVFTDSPGMRFEQDGSSWPAYTWDVVGNETNFFIRDVTNANKLPFRIKSGALTNSLTVDLLGRVGVGGTYYSGFPAAEEKLHVYGSLKADTFLIANPLETFPENPPKGAIAMSNTDDVLNYYDGSSWQAVDIASYELRIASLEARIASLEAELGGVSKVEHVSNENSALYQNIPNPTSSVTEIPYFISTDITDARIKVYSSNGAVNKQYDVRERGVKASVVLNDDELEAGLYFYTLFCDDMLVDTKTLIITE